MRRRWQKVPSGATASSRRSICKPSALRSMLRSNSRELLPARRRRQQLLRRRLPTEAPLSTAPNPADVAPAISLQKISKFFGRNAALRDVTATFARGRLYTVLGENGAGKSSLLRLIAGLATVSSGSVHVFGVPPRESLSRMGYMAHASMLYDEMTALENLRYFAGLYGMKEEGRLKSFLSGAGLDPKRERRVGKYSKGWGRRPSPAGALVHDPEVFLLDEP